MINPRNVARLISDYLKKLLPYANLTYTDTPRDEDVARNIFHSIESILNCSHYCFESEQTLDFTYCFDQQMEHPEVDSDDEEDINYTEEDDDEKGNCLL
jgi:hypothetical protein